MKKLAFMLLFLVWFSALGYCAPVTVSGPFIVVSPVGSTSLIYLRGYKVLRIVLYYNGTGVWCDGTPLSSGPTIIVSDTPAAIVAAVVAAGH